MYNKAWLAEKNITIGDANDLSFLEDLMKVNGL